MLKTVTKFSLFFFFLLLSSTGAQVSGNSPVNVEITFKCNMDNEVSHSRFDPKADTVSVRGDFNNWKGTWEMKPNADNRNVYEITRTISTYQGDSLHYKFVYAASLGTNWESGDNSEYIVTADDIAMKKTTISRCFDYHCAVDDLGLEQPATVKFTVDMKNAVAGSGPSAGQPFTKIESVGLAGAISPLHWPGSEWPDADKPILIELNDSGLSGDEAAGDQIWSKDVVFNKMSSCRVEYRYAVNWGLATNLGLNNNESSADLRHIHLFSGPDVESVTLVDTFGVMGFSAQKDIKTTDVKTADNQIPQAYSLGQNFPNPFNPSTTINFSVPAEGYVSLKVFNTLGQEVATLVNGVRSAGTYTATFDASGLSSGMYFYTIQTKGFMQTKKMVLTK